MFPGSLLDRRLTRPSGCSSGESSPPSSASLARCAVPDKAERRRLHIEEGPPPCLCDPKDSLTLNVDTGRVELEAIAQAYLVSILGRSHFGSVGQALLLFPAV